MPLWSENGNAVFAQPGFVFWTGLADEERIDGNLGIAYRVGLAEDIIGGASVFYDRDFKQGHSRVSLGADVQSGFLHGAANYYQPLGDEQDGREGFVEEAVRGMNFQLAFQRDVMRVSGNLGYWRFEGDDSVESDWKISYGLDAGIRVFPVFSSRVDGRDTMKTYRSTIAGMQAWRFAFLFPTSGVRVMETD